MKIRLHTTAYYWYICLPSKREAKSFLNQNWEIFKKGKIVKEVIKE